jgi:Leucine-rich repeat (LRR) protein
MFDLSLTKVIPSVEPTTTSSGNASGGVPKSKSTPKIDSNSENSSEMSDESSGGEEDVEEAEETESTPKGSKEPKSRLKSKLAQLSPLKKRSEDSSPKTPSRSKRISSTSSGQVSSSMAKTPEERAAQQAKLMFPNLTHLDLSFNKLTRLPSHLAYLDNLSYLNASSNPSLVRVSPKLGLLNKLWNFDLKNCPNLREPVMLDALVKQKTKTSDILGYLKSILEHSRPYTRMKLMFVGVQAIGKTSLLNRLREEGTTNSINRHSWTERTTSQSSAPSQVNGYYIIYIYSF